MRVKFFFFESAAQEEQFRCELRPWLWMIPPWCEVLRVENVNPGKNSDAALAIAPSPHYRRARLEVYPHWFASDAASRRACIAHEMFHLLTGELIHFVRDRVLPEIHRENPALGDFIEQGFLDLLEGCTETFAHIVCWRSESETTTEDAS